MAARIKQELGALFYPKGTKEKPIKFDSLYIPYIYKEIYIEKLYDDIFTNLTDATILDVGANIGVVTQYMRDFAKVVHAIEPSSEHFEALQENKRFNKWDNVEVHKTAIADRDGSMTLNVNTINRTCHSLTKDLGSGYTDQELVTTVRFDTFLKKNKIKKVDFCKFDVEGAEDMILRSEGFVNVADKFKAIEVEFHFPTWQQLVDHMIKLGFSARRYKSSAIIVLFTR